jgi:hypothetical protein
MVLALPLEILKTLHFLLLGGLGKLVAVPYVFVELREGEHCLGVFAVDR